MNVLRRISITYAVLLALLVVISVSSLVALSYLTSQLQTQRTKQVQLATLTGRVRAGFYAEIDSARTILLERTFNMPTRTDPGKIAAPVDDAEAALMDILPDAASTRASRPSRATSPCSCKPISVS